MAEGHNQRGQLRPRPFFRESLVLDEEQARGRMGADSRLLFFETLPSSIEVVELLIARLFGRLGTLGCMNGQRAELEIVLREAVANAIIHGNDNDASKRVDVRCFLDGSNCLWFVVRDQGRGFDATGVPDPTESANLQRSCGRGIFLIRHFMDRVEFARQGSEIRMCKKLPKIA